MHVQPTQYQNLNRNGSQDGPVHITEDWFKRDWEEKLQAGQQVACTENSRYDVLYVALRECDRDLQGMQGAKQEYWKTMIRLAIETGSFSTTNTKGLQRLVHAWLEKKHLDVIDTLLSSRHFSLKTPIFDDGSTLLHWSAGWSQLELFNKILACKEADVHSKTGPKQDSVLDYALQAYSYQKTIPGILAIIQTLVDKGCSYKQENQRLLEQARSD